MARELDIYGFNTTDFYHQGLNALRERSAPSAIIEEFIGRSRQAIAMGEIYWLADHVSDLSANGDFEMQNIGIHNLINSKNLNLVSILCELIDEYNEGEYEDPKPDRVKFEEFDSSVLLMSGEMMNLMDWFIAVSYQCSGQGDLYQVNPDKFKREAALAASDCGSLSKKILAKELFELISWRDKVRNSNFEFFIVSDYY